MHRPTVAIGIAMVVLGIAVYFGTGRGSITALIPSFIGFPIFLCGVLAATARTPALATAFVLSVLGFLGPLGRIGPAAAKGELSIGTALIGQLLFMCLAAILAVILLKALRRRDELG